MLGQDSMTLNSPHQTNFATEQLHQKHSASFKAKNDQEMTNTRLASGKMKSSYNPNMKNVS